MVKLKCSHTFNCHFSPQFFIAIVEFGCPGLATQKSPLNLELVCGMRGRHHRSRLPHILSPQNGLAAVPLFESVCRGRDPDCSQEDQECGVRWCWRAGASWNCLPGFLVSGEIILVVCWTIEPSKRSQGCGGLIMNEVTSLAWKGNYPRELWPASRLLPGRLEPGDHWPQLSGNGSWFLDCVLVFKI